MERPDECHECLQLKELKRIGSRFQVNSECSKGHPYTPENTIVEVNRHGKKSNRCRECRNGRRRSYVKKEDRL